MPRHVGLRMYRSQWDDKPIPPDAMPSEEEDNRGQEVLPDYDRRVAHPTIGIDDASSDDEEEEENTGFIALDNNSDAPAFCPGNQNARPVATDNFSMLVSNARRRHAGELVDDDKPTGKSKKAVQLKTMGFRSTDELLGDPDGMEDYHSSCSELEYPSSANDDSDIEPHHHRHGGVYSRLKGHRRRRRKRSNRRRTPLDDFRLNSNIGKLHQRMRENERQEIRPMEVDQQEEDGDDESSDNDDGNSVDEPYWHQERCFGCHQDSKGALSMDGRAFNTILALIDYQITTTMSLKDICQQAHTKFKEEIWMPNRHKKDKYGRRMPMWRTKSIYEHLTKHTMSPRVQMMLQLRELRRERELCTKMQWKIQADPEGNQDILLNKPVWQQKKDIIAREWQLAKLDVTKLNSYRADRHIDLSSQSVLVNVAKKLRKVETRRAKPGEDSNVSAIDDASEEEERDEEVDEEERLLNNRC